MAEGILYDIYELVLEKNAKLTSIAYKDYIQICLEWDGKEFIEWLAINPIYEQYMYY